MRRLAPALLAVALLACRAAPPGPDDAALELFLLARQQPLSEERLEALFDLRRDDPLRAPLLDALAHLRLGGGPVVTEVQALQGLGRTAVDLDGELPGGGVARFSVQLEPSGEGWKVRWFQGPGVEWPPSRERRNEGLSSSAPPGAGIRKLEGMKK